jgi:MoaA/NifB/PqqE/SkfB family radical SAM enzyme
MDEVIISVTERCDSRCVMCNIWKTGGEEEVKPSAYASLPKRVRTVRVTGGEPFLREDLPEVIRAIDGACGKPRFVISTNGLDPMLVERQMKEILKITKKVGVRVSLDAVGVLHDRLRGVEGAYDKALETLERLKKIGVEDLGVAFTIQKSNVEEISKVYDLACKLGVEFTGCLVEGSDFRYYKTDVSLPEIEELAMQLDYVIARELKTGNPKQWFRAYYFKALGDYAKFKLGLEKKPRKLECTAVEKFAYIRPDGSVHACILREECLGNIKEKKMEEILKEKKVEEMKMKVRYCPLNCWTMCNVTTTMKKYFPHVLAWITASKIKAHLGFKQFVER